MNSFSGLRRSTTVDFSLCDLETLERRAPSLDSRAAVVAAQGFKMTFFTRNSVLRPKSIEIRKPSKDNIQPADFLRRKWIKEIEKMMKADRSKGAVPLDVETTSKEGARNSIS